ncbi:Uncharacterised protein [Serratia grimesii]|nr:Uncharacterised protein [Serratia grimesii]
MASDNKRYLLTDETGHVQESPLPGTLGGHRRNRLYGRLDCRAALQAIARGGYVRHRVFFANKATAIAAGYRPCAVCMPEEYAAWKSALAPETKKISRRYPYEQLISGFCQHLTA